MERFEMEKEKTEKCKNFSNISMVELRRKQSLKRMITSNVEGILKAMFDLLVGKSGSERGGESGLQRRHKQPL